MRVFYSRDKNHYAGLSARYVPAFYTYAKMMSGVARLEDAGLIEHIKTTPSPSSRLRSRISASPLLLSRVADVSLDFVFASKEVIILRGADRWPLTYDDTARTTRMRGDVLEQNEFLGGFDIRLEHPRDTYGAHGFMRVDGRWLDPRRRSYYRVFNRRFTLGGRWYGPFWQNLPSDVREYMLINGELVVERDYRACHLRLLCGRAGLDLPFRDEDFDPYQIEGFDRSHIKLALNIMLNADTERGARRAIARELSPQNVANAGHWAHSLVDAVRYRFPGLEQFWCSRVGLRLQNVDAEICRRVQRRLRHENIPVLSVHDSFIVPASFNSVLNDVMEEEMDQAVRARKRPNNQSTELAPISVVISSYLPSERLTLWRRRRGWLDVLGG